MIDRWLETRPTQTPLHLTKETLHLRNFTTLARLVYCPESHRTHCAEYLVPQCNSTQLDILFPVCQMR